MKRSRVPLVLFFFVGCFSVPSALPRVWGTESAEACSLIVKSFQSDLLEHPADVLTLFGAAVKLSPDCLRELFQTAIRDARPDEKLLRRMIQTALREYPEEADTIAGACIEEAPEMAEGIKAAFISLPSSSEAKKANATVAKKNLSPVDRYLESQNGDESTEVSPEYKTEDKKIEEAVAKMAARFEGKSGIIPAPKIALPEALIEEKTVAGKVPNPPAQNPIQLSQSNRIKLKHLSGAEKSADAVTLSHLLSFGLPGEAIPDSTQPILLGNGSEKTEAPLINDQPEKATPSDNGKTEPGHDPSNASKAPSPSQSPPQTSTEETSLHPPHLDLPSSVYYIPPASKPAPYVGGEIPPVPDQANRIILRSNPVSPTSPR